MTLKYCLQIVIGFMSISTVETIIVEFRGYSWPRHHTHVTFLILSKQNVQKRNFAFYSMMHHTLISPTGSFNYLVFRQFKQLGKQARRKCNCRVQRLWCSWWNRIGLADWNQTKLQLIGSIHTDLRLRADKHTLSLLLITLVPVTSPTITFMFF